MQNINHPPDSIKTKVADTVKLSATNKEITPEVKTTTVDSRKVEKITKTAFILTLIGYGLLFVPVADIFSIFLLVAALILGIIGLRRIKEKPNELKGKGYAITAIIGGALFLAFLLGLIIYAITLL